jgi:hypothetical protein
MPVVDSLRRVLYLTALIWGVAGLMMTALPRFLLVTVMGQPVYEDYAWVRIGGIDALALALLAVLVAHHLDQAWWWTWAFVLVAAGEAWIFTLNALIGAPPGAAVWPWWLFAGGQWALAAGLVWGLARAGAERPPA